MDTTLIRIQIEGINPPFCKRSWKNYISLDNSISDEDNVTSIAKKLFDALEECKSPIKSIKRITDLDTQLTKGIYFFTSGGGRGEYL